MIKRVVDFILSGMLLLVLSPLFLLISGLIKLDSKGPVFYKSIRIGKGGKAFGMLKFRSMVNHAELMGPGITTKDDSRITQIGKLLRATKLDELPNLFNVLKGDLSLVGPRPEIPQWVAKYTPQQSQVLTIRPGITGPAQLKYINESLKIQNLDKDYPTILADKLALDLDYLNSASSLSDLRILLTTLKMTLTKCCVLKLKIKTQISKTVYC